MTKRDAALVVLAPFGLVAIAVALLVFYARFVR